MGVRPWYQGSKFASGGFCRRYRWGCVGFQRNVLGSSPGHKDLKQWKLWVWVIHQSGWVLRGIPKFCLWERCCFQNYGIYPPARDEKTRKTHPECRSFSERKPLIFYIFFVYPRVPNLNPSYGRSICCCTSLGLRKEIIIQHLEALLCVSRPQKLFSMYSNSSKTCAHFVAW